MLAKILVSTVFFCFFLAKPTIAVTVTISNVPHSITDQPFDLNIVIEGASPATNYLRADFFQPNTTNYFGYTYNGTNYYNGSDFSQYLPIAITSSGYTGTVKAKIDTSSSKFHGNGTYNLRIRRYTKSGSYTTNESNIITLNASSLTPTPSPTTTHTPTPSPAPSPTPVPTPIPTPQITPSPVSSAPSPQPTTSQQKTSAYQILAARATQNQTSTVAAVATTAPSILPTTSPIVKIIITEQVNIFKIAGVIILLAGITIMIFIFIKSNIKSKAL